MLQRTGEAETITTHYLFALGIYRALYIPNWIYRYYAEGHVDPISIVAGVIQTILYSDFFWIYYTKSVGSFRSQNVDTNLVAGSSRARSSTSPFKCSPKSCFRPQTQGLASPSSTTLLYHRGDWATEVHTWWHGIRRSGGSDRDATTPKTHDSFCAADDNGCFGSYEEQVRLDNYDWWTFLYYQ